MTQYERAAQIWSVLAWAATNRQELTYDIVGRLIGVPRQGLGRLLEPIQSYCLVRQLPPLTLLVVSEVNGQPNPGFTATQQIPKSGSECSDSNGSIIPPRRPRCSNRPSSNRRPTG
jgi:hypothetical protein